MTKHQSKKLVASDPFWAWFYDFHIFEVMKRRQDMTGLILSRQESMLIEVSQAAPSSRGLAPTDHTEVKIALRA
ncbi:hypothetical protein BTVI_104978 [Pitangus sulphuratus]|nr:hypothetical protein BTVI_104978 [Pitangus sulphuratus]